MGGERKSLWTALVLEPQRGVDRAMRLLTEHSDVWGVAVKERSTRWNGIPDNVRVDVVISCKRCRASTLAGICRLARELTPQDENSKRAFWHSLKSRTGYKILKDASPTLPKTKKRRPDKKRPTPGNALGLKAPAIIYDFLTSRDYCRLQAALKSSKKIEAGHAGVAEFWCRMRATASGAKPRKARRSTSTAATATPQSSTAHSTPPQLQDRLMQHISRSEQAVKMDQERSFQLSRHRGQYCGLVKLHGEAHGKALLAATNYSSTLKQLKRFKEAKTLLRKTIPVARRVLGADNNLTLKMRVTYAVALYDDTDATLDDVREAVTTLTETVRIARRVLGGADPDAMNAERELRYAQLRAALRSREETQPSPGGG